MPTPKLTELFNNVVHEISVYRERVAEQKVATSAVGKQKTVLRNLFKHWLKEANLPPRTAILINGSKITFDTASSEKVDPKLWYDLWQKGEITKDQYFDTLSVNKAEAVLIIGADQVNAVEVTVHGDKADIRIDDDNEGTEDGIRVLRPDAARKKPGIVRRTDLQVSAKLDVPRMGLRRLQLRRPS